MSRAHGSLRERGRSGGRPSTRIAALAVAMSLACWLTAIAPARLDAAGPPDADRLGAMDDYLRSAVADLGVPGLELIVVEGDQVAHQLALGTADETGRPMTIDTPVHLASLSKAFTATAILQLVEQGSVELDAPVQRYLPWFTVADPDQASRITVRELLDHTAGFSTLVGQRYTGLVDDAPGAVERQVRSLAGVSLDSKPGETFQYSNANYDVLAAIVETVSGMPFASYLQAHIFEPAGMGHSHADRAAADADGLAPGSSPWFELLWRPTDVPVSGGAAGAAGVYASAGDLGRWLVAQMNGGSVEGVKILEPASMALEHTPQVAVDDFHAYAMGWNVRPLWEALDMSATGPATGSSGYELPDLIEHGGSWPNTHTYIGMVPDQGWGFALLVDGSDPRHEGAFDLLEQNLLRISQGKEPLAYDASGEDFVVANAVIIALVLLLAELISLAWSIRAIRRTRRREPMDRGQRRRLAIAWLIAIGLDLLVVVAFLPALASTVELDLLRFARGSPDTALLVLPTLALAVIWGPIRSLILAWRLVRRRPETPPAADAQPPTGTASSPV